MRGVILPRAKRCSKTWGGKILASANIGSKTCERLDISNILVGALRLVRSKI